MLKSNPFLLKEIFHVSAYLILKIHFGLKESEKNK